MNVATERFLLFDALGSVDRILGPSQSVTDRYLYEAFGKEVLKTGTTRNPFRWLGQIGYYTETETAGGVPIYVRARQYSPVQGRWLSVDPVYVLSVRIVRHDGLIYALNRSTSFVDPSGLDPLPPPCQGCSPEGAKRTRHYNGGKYMIVRNNCVDCPDDCTHTTTVAYTIVILPAQDVIDICIRLAGKLCWDLGRPQNGQYLGGWGPESSCPGATGKCPPGYPVEVYLPLD